MVTQRYGKVFSVLSEFDLVTAARKLAQMRDGILLRL
jgi:hypothetical protein